MSRLITHSKATGYIGGGSPGDHDEELSVMLGINEEFKQGLAEAFGAYQESSSQRETADDHSHELSVMLGIETYRTQPGQPSGQSDHSDEIEAMLGF